MNDFHKGQQVIHCRDGLSVIVEQTVISDNPYFVLKAIRGGGENIYVSVERAAMSIRPLMTAEEADKLLKSAKAVEFEFNPNTKQRRDGLKRRLASGDVNDVVYLFKQYYYYKKNNDPSIKYGPVDIEMLEYASNNLLDELAIAYNKHRDEIEEFAFKKLV